MGLVGSCSPWANHGALQRHPRASLWLGDEVLLWELEWGYGSVKMICSGSHTSSPWSLQLGQPVHPGNHLCKADNVPFHNIACALTPTWPHLGPGNRHREHVQVTCWQVTEVGSELGNWTAVLRLLMWPAPGHPAPRPGLL